MIPKPLEIVLWGIAAWLLIFWIIFPIRLIWQAMKTPSRTYIDPGRDDHTAMAKVVIIDGKTRVIDIKVLADD